ncbi:hypothetical protein [Legionella maioricensis]|uniref:APOBEC-like N-terminal domain-containing protein n=1 Tax=Legionella maioricensis TaxID=2896528 RepID=A0A9X2D3C0_9GAMM|nr:hypothetical protein [Legionella maioricensis]MCL9685764.1 hypothetical protein [Legionella maioricensis]
MKIYPNLSEALRAFPRKSKEVFAIISFNGQAYFVFRSNPDAEVATIIQAHNKMVIGNELLKLAPENVDRPRKERLYKLMIEGGASKEFPEKSRHAEENLIRGFPTILNDFKKMFPNQKINKIDIFLTHSPCSKKGSKKYSSQCTVHNFFLPEGCDKKLTVFFKNKNYINGSDLFSSNPGVRVHYNHKFDPSVSNEGNEFIKEADPELKSVLSKYLDNGPGSSI